MSKYNNQNSQVGEQLRRKNVKAEKCKETESVLMQWSQQKLYLYLTDVFLKKMHVFVYEYFKITEEGKIYNLVSW